MYARQRRDDRYARIAHGRALPSMEWRGAHSGAALREPFMDVHAMRCILIHTPRVAVPRSAAPLRLQPFARPGTLANAGRPAHVTAFQPTMKSLRRSTATPREAKAMHSFGAGVTHEPNDYKPFDTDAS